MAVAQSPISNNAPGARWYREAVTGSIMEIYSQLLRAGREDFLSVSCSLSTSSALSLSSCHSVPLFISLSLSFCQAIGFFPILSCVRGAQRIGPTTLYRLFKAAVAGRSATGLTMAAILISVAIISVLGFFFSVYELRCPGILSVHVVW